MVNRRKIHWRDTFFVASPGEGFNEFVYVSGAIEARAERDQEALRQMRGMRSGHLRCCTRLNQPCLVSSMATS
jgi:hypothetical protein